MTHFGTSVAAEAGTPESWAPLAGQPGDEVAAARLGLAATLYHWGLQAWAIYAVVGLSLALFTFNKGLPLSIRSSFYPIFGEAVWGWVGHVIDILAVLATLFGLATSLGLGAEQINAGLNYLYGVPVSDTAKIVLIAAITGVALISVVRGLDGGVKVASEINMVLAFVLLSSSSSSPGPTMALIGTHRRLLRRLLPVPARAVDAVRARGRELRGRAGRRSTGRGGCPGRRSSACSSPASAAGARCASSSSACCSCPRPSA